MKSIEEIKLEYPLHWQIWQNNVDELKDLLRNDKVSGIIVYLLFVIAK